MLEPVAFETLPAGECPKMPGGVVLQIAMDSDGMLASHKIVRKRFATIEQGDLKDIKAIVLHQTDTWDAQSTFNSYGPGGTGNGAHFLIDKDGQIYQTASIKKRCYHIGKLIRSKCLTLNTANCKTPEMAKVLVLGWKRQWPALDKIERAKKYPDRYPVNSDSIGIELVGRHVSNTAYEAVTPNQQLALDWFLPALLKLLTLTSTDTYRHPEVSYKNPGEAATAVWK